MKQPCRTGSIASRAERMDRFLKERVGGRDINFLAHSMVCPLGLSVGTWTNEETGRTRLPPFDIPYPA